MGYHESLGQSHQHGGHVAEFRAFDPDVEVQGDVVLSFIHAMGAFKALAVEILKRHAIESPQKHLWYPQQAWLDAFATIASEVGPSTLIQIGRQVPQQAHYRPGLHGIDAVLLELDDAYKRAHRGGEVGSYRFQPTGLRSGNIICNTPYPCEFERGLLHSLASSFAPADALIDLQHDRAAGECKKKGHPSCKFHLSW